MVMSSDFRWMMRRTPIELCAILMQWRQCDPVRRDVSSGPKGHVFVRLRNLLRKIHIPEPKMDWKEFWFFFSNKFFFTVVLVPMSFIIVPLERCGMCVLLRTVQTFTHTHTRMRRIHVCRTSSGHLRTPYGTYQEEPSWERHAYRRTEYKQTGR